MEKYRFFPYNWHIDEDETEITSIRIYGLDEKNENVCVRVDDFTPYVYIELPNNITWNPSKAQLVNNKLDELLGKHKAILKRLTFKKKLYGAHIDMYKKRKEFPYLLCTFSSRNDIKTLGFKLRQTLHVAGIGAIKLKIHESDADPILQLTSCRKISTAGWIEFYGKRKDEESKLTLCEHEFTVKYKYLTPFEKDCIPKPKIMSFDLEVNSTNPSAMPKARNPGDKIFQISCVVYRDGDKPENYEKYIHTLGNPNQEITGDDVLIYMYETEAALLEGFPVFIKEENINLIIGYNILGFDIPYMIDRAKLNMCIFNFDKQGFHKFAHAREKTIKWSSSAYKNQEFQFLDAEGRLYIDLLPLVKRDYKLSNYKLKTVSEKFIGVTKDPLSVKGIFKCYRLGIKKDKNGGYGALAQKAMGICAKYCVQDSMLVALLMDKLKIWVSLTEMAKTCCVPIFTLYTQGQQIKVYSQLYRYAMYENIVVEKDAYQVSDNERYIGAKVFPPVPGRYKMVVPFDFASLYPTTIIAYNIDYHTWVQDDSNIPDSDCHVMEWSDHQGCIVKGSRITIGEYSDYIENLEQYRDNLLAYDTETGGMKYFKQTGFFNQGIKDCIQIIMEDGTNLKCTPDHKILLSDGSWVEAQDIKVETDRVSIAYSPPVYDITNEELVIGKYHFTGSRLIKFYKILGILCTDGHTSHNRTKLYCGHPIDLSNIVRDIEDLEKNSTSVRKENYGWGITILGELGKMFRNLDGILWGAKVNQYRTLPTILEQASVGELRAFMSGLFGGDGHTFSYSEKAQCMGTISLSWTSRQPKQLNIIFSQLQKYMDICGICTTITRVKDETYLRIKTSNLLKFKETIGFSYCIHKSMRLEAGYSYLKMRNEVWEQQKWLVYRIRTLKKTMSIDKATIIAINELKLEFPIYNEYYASPTAKQVNDLLRSRKKWEKPMFSYKYFPTCLEYFKTIGANSFFESYSVEIKEISIPRLFKKIIKIVKIGKHQVYDLEVNSSHSFVSDGVVVHNCIHDPKIIRKMELTTYIDTEKAIIKKIREKRNKTLDKYRKAEIKLEIDTKVNDLKPYIKERSEINKSKPKFTMCAKRYYRFLKEPRGVLPTIIQNLLDARKHTRKVDMVACYKKIDELKADGGDHKKEISELNSLLSVLDKRQLAYKVSANSIYGIMGVRKGKIPFMPGAMCTTYMGRVNIDIVANVVVNKYKGELIYGDTDCLIATSPTLVQYLENGKTILSYETVETLSDGEWTRINPNKEISKAKAGYKIWSDQGFTDIVNVVRCGIQKPLSRVLTHVGEVTCSNEHSLLRDTLESATPDEIKIKDKLCISELPLPNDTPEIPVYKNNLTAEVIRSYIIPDETYEDLTAELAFVWGVFFADGSCGSYERIGRNSAQHNWGINKKDNLLLERCMDIMVRSESKLTFKILDTMKSSHVNKMIANGEKKLFVKKYRELFYDNRKYKKIPTIIFNAPFNIRQSFFMGYYAGDGSKKDPALSITNKGAIGSAGLFYLLRSIGYKVSINTRTDKPDIYKLTGSTPVEKFRYKPNAVKKIVPMVGEEDGYIYDIQTSNHHFAAGVGQLVVHNSNYITFPHLETAPEIWDYSIKVAEEITKLFPAPIELEFENEIYAFFFIVSKKRYMYRKCLRNGIVNMKLDNKGVCLARRDNCNYLRETYEGVINKIADNMSRDDIFYWILDRMNLMFSRQLPHTDFVVTKAVGNAGNLHPEPFINEKGVKKAKIGDYTTPILSKIKNERDDQLIAKGAENAEDFYLLCLPAQVQLAERMRRRGQRVDAGSRIEYIITDPEHHTAKQYEKVESSDYYAKHKNAIKIDYYYYLKALINPIDQVLDTAFPEEKEFVLNQYKFRWKIRHKLINELKDLFRTKIVLFE